MSAPDRRFTVLGEHAHGGLGIVGRAQDNALHRLVALKQIRPDRLDSPRVRQRFLNAGKLDDAARTALRTRAHGWLRDDLTALERILQSGQPDDRKFVGERLQEWQQATEFADLRAATALARLPSQEQAAWNAFWADVTRTAQRAKALAKEK